MLFYTYSTCIISGYIPILPKSGWADITEMSHRKDKSALTGNPLLLVYRENSD